MGEKRAKAYFQGKSDEIRQREQEENCHRIRCHCGRIFRSLLALGLLLPERYRDDRRKRSRRESPPSQKAFEAPSTFEKEGEFFRVDMVHWHPSMPCGMQCWCIFLLLSIRG